MAGEFDIIATYFAPLADDPSALGLCDDAAELSPPPGADLVLTKDAMVASVHFFESDPPDLVARKLARVNLSDLAAKGADPLGYLLGLALPAAWSASELEGFAEGLRLDQAEFGWSLLGGDTVATPGPLTLSLTAIGHVPRGTMIKRKGAKAGDLVFVTGTIGDAALGLRIQKGEFEGGASRDDLIHRYHLPEPRLSVGRELRRLATAALDVSDGLIADLTHLAQSSGVAVALDLEAIPFSGAAQDLVDAGLVSREELAAGGDDYEIVFSVAPERAPEVPEIAERTGVPIRQIGRVLAGAAGEILDRNGEKTSFKSKGYDHFSK